MTDLTKAIAKLFAAAKELAEYISYFEIVGGVFVNCPQIWRGCDAVFAAIAQFPEDENFGRFVPALIPATERDAAVAAALQEAAERFPDGRQPWPPHAIRKAILALITQPQADALARVRAETVKVKPLVWKIVPTGYGPETYEAYAATGFYQVFTDEDSACGTVFAEFATDQSQFGMVSARKVARVNGFAQAKAAAQADHDARIRAAIGGVE